MDKILFSSWSSLLRVVVIGFAGYVGLVAILRISGNRTLSKMNSFDFIVTIALGSTFASSLLQKSVTIVDALLAFAVLVGLQYVTTWLSVRWPAFDRAVKSEPILLYADGEFLRAPMKRAHVTEDEVLAGMREQGFPTRGQVAFVVLETNGKIVAVGKHASALGGAPGESTL